MPLTRIVSVTGIPPEGLDVEVVADEAERAALARDFKLPAIHRLEGRYRLTPLAAGRVHVEGAVTAEIRQTCVVTLEPVENMVAEEVDLTFASQGGPLAAEETAEPPDVIVGGVIDLGALTAEFLALGLDPYPRKPGAVFEGDGSSGPDSPFAVLTGLRGQGGSEQ